MVVRWCLVSSLVTNNCELCKTTLTTVNNVKQQDAHH